MQKDNIALFQISFSIILGIFPAEMLPSLIFRFLKFHLRSLISEGPYSFVAVFLSRIILFAFTFPDNVCDFIKKKTEQREQCNTSCLPYCYHLHRYALKVSMTRLLQKNIFWFEVVRSFEKWFEVQLRITGSFHEKDRTIFERTVRWHL